ncbi:MAG: hypothetical protein JOY70_09375 [Acidisphaera sp.]|nr:hypothetical protein [Acidisphaera sp.]
MTWKLVRAFFSRGQRAAVEFQRVQAGPGLHLFPKRVVDSRELAPTESTPDPLSAEYPRMIANIARHRLRAQREPEQQAADDSPFLEKTDVHVERDRLLFARSLVVLNAATVRSVRD